MSRTISRNLIIKNILLLRAIVPIPELRRLYFPSSPYGHKFTLLRCYALTGFLFIG
jgi:hypothetical protein